MHCVNPIDLKTVWNTLVDASASPSIFLTWEWVEAWLAVFGAQGEPRVVAALDDRGAVEGFAPLFERRVRRGPFRLSIWTPLGTGVGADHLTFVSPRGRDLTTQIMEDLLHGDARWDVLELNWMQEAQARRVADAVAESGAPYGCLVTTAAPSPVLALPAAWDAYEHTLSSSFRAGLARQRRRLERDRGPVRFRQVETWDEFAAAWEMLVRLHQARWRARGHPGAFAEERFRAFHKRFGEAALGRGWLRFHTLEAGGETGALLYGFRYGPRALYLLGAFDPGWARYGPGNLLITQAIRQAIDEGAAEFDFLRGDESYKLRWKPDLRSDCHVVVFRRDPRVIAAVALTRWARRLRAAVR